MTYANRVVPATSLTKAVNISATLLAVVKRTSKRQIETGGAMVRFCAACSPVRGSGGRTLTYVCQRQNYGTKVSLLPIGCVGGDRKKKPALMCTEHARNCFLALSCGMAAQHFTVRLEKPKTKRGAYTQQTILLHRRFPLDRASGAKAKVHPICSASAVYVLPRNTIFHLAWSDVPVPHGGHGCEGPVYACDVPKRLQRRNRMNGGGAGRIGARHETHGRNRETTNSCLVYLSSPTVCTPRTGQLH